MAAAAIAAALRLVSCCRMWQGGFGASMQMVAAAATAARPIRIPDRRVVYEAAPPLPSSDCPFTSPRPTFNEPSEARNLLSHFVFIGKMLAAAAAAEAGVIKVNKAINIGRLLQGH